MRCAADLVGDWVSGVMADTDAFFTPEPTTDYTLRPAPDGDVLTFPSALDTPQPSNNTVYCRYFPARGRSRGRNCRGRPSAVRDARGRSRASAMELRRRGTCRAVPAARVERHERAATQPAVSRSAHAARTASRRLHRQRQHRAHAAGVPAGGARRAAGDRVAARRRATIASAFSAPASDRVWRC